MIDERIFFMNKVHPTCALNDLVHYRNWFGCKPHKFSPRVVNTMEEAVLVSVPDLFQGYL